jgi:hypothetical protein
MQCSAYGKDFYSYRAPQVKPKNQGTGLRVKGPGWGKNRREKMGQGKRKSPFLPPFVKGERGGFVFSEA